MEVNRKLAMSLLGLVVATAAWLVLAWDWRPSLVHEGQPSSGAAGGDQSKDTPSADIATDPAEEGLLEVTLAGGNGPEVRGELSDEQCGHSSSQGPWEEVLADQRSLCSKLRLVKARAGVGDWTGRRLEDVVRALAADLGVPVTLHPSVARNSSQEAPSVGCGVGESAWEALEYLVAAKALSLRVQRNSLSILPYVRADDPHNVAEYEADPLAAFRAAKKLMQQDSSFYSRWQGIEASENAEVRIPPDAKFLCLASVLDAISKSLQWRVDAAYDTSQPVASEGLREGRAIDVMRSWCRDAIVVSTRCGLRATLDPAHAERYAADIREYERIRTLLNESTWFGPSREMTLKEFVQFLASATGLQVLLDPQVQTITVCPVNGETLLSVLSPTHATTERTIAPRFGWTYAASRLVISAWPSRPRDL